MATHRYEIHCCTEGRFVATGWSKLPPTICPNNNAHIVGGSRMLDSNVPASNHVVLFRDSTNPYLLLNPANLPSGTYVNVATIPYDGSARTPTTASIIASYTGGMGATGRIVRSDDNTVIATVTLTTTSNTFQSFTVINPWPTVAVPLLLQLQQNGGATVTLQSLNYQD